MLPPLLIKLDAGSVARRPFAPQVAPTVPVGTHPNQLNNRAHAIILYQSIVAETATGTRFWERPITDAILNWSTANHAGLKPEKRQPHTSQIENAAFESLYQLLSDGNVLPPPTDDFYADIKFSSTTTPPQGEHMAWMLKLCRTINGVRNDKLEKIKKYCWTVNAITKNWLKDDKEVALAAMQYYIDIPVFHRRPHPFQHVSVRLTNDKDVALAAVEKKPEMLQFASNRLRDDEDVVLAAIKNMPFALEFASDRLKGERDVVLAAVSQHPGALEFASEELKQNMILGPERQNCEPPVDGYVS